MATFLEQQIMATKACPQLPINLQKKASFYQLTDEKVKNWHERCSV